jgi:hypothetical protein
MIMNFKFAMTALALCVCLVFPSSKSEAAPPEHQNYSIAVYGGSISSLPESNYAKNHWAQELGMPVFTYGVGGAGFTKFTTQPDIPTQVELSPKHKVVVLWCSTNDFGRAVEGEDKFSRETQNGGMRVAIERLREKEPECIILGFCSLPIFPNAGDPASPGAGHVAGQIAVFEEYGIPYLNQFGFFTADDVSEMYMPDKVHLTPKGYTSISERQAQFLKQNITE